MLKSLPWKPFGLLLGLMFMAMSFAQDDSARTLRGELQLEDIVEYYALPSYTEAPELAALVEQGKLPPVEERLPREPRVLKQGQMVDGPGVHGGVWRDTFAVPVESWNWGAGQTQGWFGVNELVQEALVDLFPMWMMENPEPAPRLATSWEWSEDGHQLTMHLIEGARWSDGTPFTADDVLFTYENYILDPNVPSWSQASAWTYGGEVTRLEKIDDYTIRFHFGAPFPVAAFNRMGYLNFSIMPKHVFSHYHPAFNPEMEYTDLLTSAPPQDLPPVTLGAYVPVIYRPGEQLILVRNPYHYQVDEEGNQLPYHSEIWYAEASSGEQRTFNLQANRGDRDNVENPQIFGLMFEASQAPDSHFDLRFEDFRIGYRLEPNLSLTRGANTPRARALREMFRTFEFRRALSHAIDRDGLATAAFPGPLTQGWQGGYQSASPYFDEALKELHAELYTYDPEQSRTLLAELGFRDTDGDGILNWPEGAEVAGQNLIIEALVSEDATASVEAGQALIALFREVDIDLRLRPLTSGALNTQINSGEFDVLIFRIDSPTPDVQMGDFGPVTENDPQWHQAGPGGRELLPFEEQMAELFNEARFTADPVRRTEIFHEILDLHLANIYTLGLYEARAGLAVHKRLRNIPDDLPTFQYEWGMENMPWLAWTAPEEQIAPRFLEYIPTAEDYENRDWNQ
jgi:peptide/nickel transport system substrate-binding protein